MKSKEVCNLFLNPLKHEVMVRWGTSENTESSSWKGKAFVEASDGVLHAGRWVGVGGGGGGGGGEGEHTFSHSKIMMLFSPHPSPALS